MLPGSEFLSGGGQDAIVIRMSVRPLAQNDIADQIAGDDKEDIHTDKATAKAGHPEVEQQHRQDGHAA